MDTYDSIFASSKQQLTWDGQTAFFLSSAQPLDALARSRPVGSGEVKTYGTFPESYERSPEIVVQLTIPSGVLDVFLTYETGDSLDVILLNSLDPLDARQRSYQGSQTSSKLLTNYGIGAGTYYMVIDGRSGKFQSSQIMLQARMLEIYE